MILYNAHIAVNDIFCKLLYCLNLDHFCTFRVLYELDCDDRTMRCYVANCFHYPNPVCRIPNNNWCSEVE